jgi:hydrogenase/urease accessory protein HupE
MKHRSFVRLAAATAAWVPTLAMAHPGHGEASSFVAGALHPLSGLDHLAGLIAVGVLLSRLGGRYLAPLAAALLGLMVAAGTSDSEGWRYAAGFLLSSASLVAAAMATTTAATRLRALAATAAGPRSPT